MPTSSPASMVYRDRSVHLSEHGLLLRFVIPIQFVQENNFDACMTVAVMGTVIGVACTIWGFQMTKVRVSRPWVALDGAMVLAAVTGSASLFAQDKIQEKSKDQTRDQIRDQDRLQDPIYGSQLMTDAERNEHRMQIRNLKAEREREAYRLKHHERMQERTREKGISLPPVPPIGGGGGMGPGPGGKK